MVFPRVTPIFATPSARAAAKVFAAPGEPSALRPPPQLTSENEYCALVKQKLSIYNFIFSLYNTGE
jgi:hypothetical protein